MLTKEDISQIEEKGITIKEIDRQIELFKKGVPYVNILKPATVNDGILQFSDDDIFNYCSLFQNFAANNKILKFVPASGAATRMFKDLYSFLNDNDLEKHKSVKEVINRISEFAFYDELVEILNKQSYNLGNLSHSHLIKFIVDKIGLNYGNLPKAFIKFHKYENKARTALEEHLVEGALYAKSMENDVHIHFTLSPEHIEMYNTLIKNILSDYENEFNVKFHLQYSIQSPSTDTIAVDMNNLPFRDENNKLVFRPAGHGALIHNLNNLNADIIFIKNIDNVVPDKYKNDTLMYKKAIAGLLIHLQNKMFYFQEVISKGNVGDNVIKEIKEFYLTYFHLNVQSDDILYLKQLLFRPIRVCGMVKNQGEPGGGPFWVKDESAVSLQIVESSQINLNDIEQNNIFSNSTHFNPVDIVCTFKDYKGNKYDLINFVDPNTSFISQKTKDGKPLKALELPGLWNGAMAYWNTIFVEVPIETFNPVKTINDLLRSKHLN